MLDDRKILAIQHLAEGEKTKVEIAKLIGCSRTAIYLWLDDPEFKAELNKRLQQRKSLVENIIDSKLEDMVNQLETLAISTNNDMVKAKVLTYWIDRGLGKPTDKLEVTASTQDISNPHSDLLSLEYDDVIEHTNSDDDETDE